MNFIAEIDIMPKKELLDPQGKAVEQGLQRLELNGIEQVRVGKHISLKITAASEDEAKTLTEEACKKLLANQIMESYEFSIHAQ